MSKNVSRSLVPLAAAALLAVTGCTTGAGTASSPTASPSSSATVSPSSVSASASPTATPTPSETQTPSPSFPALDVADPSTWLITFEGIGPLVVGDPLTTVRQRMDAAYTPTDEGGLCANWEVGPAFSPIVPLGMSESDPITFAAIFAGSPISRENSPKTAAGIGVGSTAAEVMAAYPNATEQHNSYAPNLAITDDGGMYIDFGLSDGVVDTVVVIDTPVAPDEYCA